MLKFKKNNLSITFFVIGSISALVLFIILYVASSIILFGAAPSKPVPNAVNGEDRYYLNQSYDNADPYMTKNPDLKDILAGPIISSADPGIGLKNAPVVMVQFSDFECDFCAEQEEVLKKIKEKYNDSLRIIWKDYPEPDYNSSSYAAAMASRCAQNQGKFWEFHDFLFKNNENLNKEIFYKGAKDLGLDTYVFEACLDDQKTRNKIDENIAEADALDIPGVPFLYINDREIMGSLSEEELGKIIQSELEINEQ